MRDLSILGITELGDPVTRPAPSRDIVSMFQDRFGLTLPAEYLGFLQHYNGGYPALDTIQPIGRPDAERWGVDFFRHLDDDRTSSGSLWAATQAWRPVLGKMALPFAEDPFGNQFFLDLSCTPAAVKVCIHDEEFAIVDIAPSWELFIDSLERNPELL